MFLVLVAQFFIKSALIRKFCQQSRGVAPHVSFDPTLADPATGERPVSVVEFKVTEVILLDHDLHRNAELTNVMDYRVMVTWQTPRAVIEVLALIEITSACLTVNGRRLETRARGLAAATRKRPGFEHLAVVAAHPQLIGSRHPRKAGP